MPVGALLVLGANPRHDPGDGFPPLIALTDRRPRDGVDERVEIMHLLLEHGANPNLRGMNDGTPLHQIVWKREAWPDHLGPRGCSSSTARTPHSGLGSMTSPLRSRMRRPWEQPNSSSRFAPRRSNASSFASRSTATSSKSSTTFGQTRISAERTPFVLCTSYFVLFPRPPSPSTWPSKRSSAPCSCW